MATNPTLLVQPIAANGAKNVIPNTTGTAGAMSQDQGFPAETALPLGAGGVAPSREDFNGAFNLLSGIAFMAQKGWVFLFEENQDYFAGCMVRDPLDGKLYEAINDVSASSTHPSVDSVNWKQSVDMSAYTTTVNSPMFNKRDVITTSGTYTAPVTGWYRITAKGGGGGGARADAEYAGGGGAGGGTTFGYEYMQVGDTATVTIGAGGTYATEGIFGAGGNGGDTTVIINTSTYVAGGGGGGTGRAAAMSIGGTGTIQGQNGGGAGTPREGYSACGGLNGGNGGYGASTGNSYTGIAGGDGYVWFEYFDSTLNP
jgi:hypothetical protein